MTSYWDFGDLSPAPPTKRPGDHYLSKNIGIRYEKEMRARSHPGAGIYRCFSFPYLMGEINKFCTFWGIKPEDTFVLDAGYSAILTAWVPMTKNDIIRFEEEKEIIDTRQKLAKERRTQKAEEKKTKDYQEKLKTFKKLKSELGL